MTTIARVLRGVDLSGSAKARSSAAASCGISRRNDRRTGDVRQQRGLGVHCRQRNIGRRAAVIEIAAETFSAEHGVALADPEQRHGDILGRAVDAIVDRPGDQPGAGHGGRGLGKHPRRVEAGDEGFGADDVGDEAGCDFRHVAGARGGQRQRARAVEAARMRNSFLRVMDGSGLRLPPPARCRAGRSPDLGNGLAEFCTRLADFEIILKSQ